MKLDAQVLRYLTRDDFRVLTAIEMGMKNHDLVPTPLIASIAALPAGPGAAVKIINTLHRNKLIYHEAKRYDGYRLTYLGFDFLALRTYVARGLITGLGRRIGVGKEADIYECCNAEGEKMILKIHRLGRISFRQIKNKRDYLLHRSNASWMYMSRLAAIREHSFLQALYAHGFPVPTPYDQVRHTILMSYVDAIPFGQVRSLRHTGRVYSNLLNLIVRLAEHGLIHADFNEFNLLIDEQDEKITLIDFPQMVSTNHVDARMYFERDVGCIVSYFSKRFGFIPGEYPKWASEEVQPGSTMDLDQIVKASGFANHLTNQKEIRDMETLLAGKMDAEAKGGKDDDEGEEEEEGGGEAGDQEEEDKEGHDVSSASSSSAAAHDVQLSECDAIALRQSVDEAEAEFTRLDEQQQQQSEKGQSSQLKQEGEEDEDEEEEDDDDEDEKEEARRHRERMARKDARQIAIREKQAMKAARKMEERTRKEWRRQHPGEATPPHLTPTAASSTLSSQADAASASAVAAAAAAAAPSVAQPANSADAGAGPDQDDAHVSHHDDDDDAHSITSATSHAFSTLSLASSHYGLLNLKLKNRSSQQQQSQQPARLKRTNRNKDKQKRKLHEKIKEYL